MSIRHDVARDAVQERCYWILAQSDTSMRQMLRAVSTGGRPHHPLLQAAFVTARMGPGPHAGSRAVRWRLLGGIVRNTVEDGVAAARGAGDGIDQRGLRSLPPQARAAVVLDRACATGGARLRGWSALQARYCLDIPDGLDVAGAAWVHRRTFQRWLAVGYGLLRNALADLELAALEAAVVAVPENVHPETGR
jgi:hypothetical protein